MVYEARDLINQRKIEHLEICIREKVEPEGASTWFEEITLLHNPLPEINLNEINTSTVFLNHEFKAPIFVSGMTGGHPQAKKVNMAIAKVVEKLGIGMGVGSQRAVLKNKDLEDTFSVVREYAPTAFIVGNIGASQLVMEKYDLEMLEKLVEMVDANALAIHLNPLHECVQIEGEPYYKGVLERVKELAENLSVPVLLKETGCGFSKEAALKAAQARISGIEIGGAGGTSFALVEYYRALRKGNMYAARIAGSFVTWGIPTAISICEVRSVTSIPLIASGGIRNGIEVAKALALGADLAGVALPVLRSYSNGGVEGVEEYLRKLIDELKITMFLTGCSSLRDLRRIPLVVSSRFNEWLKQRKIDLDFIRNKSPA
ncbi:MAG: type 2 isopentenyl-diphosphate Delta-isomerase [Thermoprotei archaeon]|nr:MAG: type 2 isopentenyl-diphosphate Delta-isomerase [Thermoprotei archaeon]